MRTRSMRKSILNYRAHTTQHFKPSNHRPSFIIPFSLYICIISAHTYLHKCVYDVFIRKDVYLNFNEKIKAIFVISFDFLSTIPPLSSKLPENICEMERNSKFFFSTDFFER